MSSGIEIDDLINESYFAMLDAVKAYNESRSEYKFNSFLSYPLKTRFNMLIGYRTKKRLNEPLNNCVSLDAPLSNDSEDITIGDTIIDDNAEFTESVLMRLTCKGVFGAVKETLKDNPKYFDVIYMKYAQNMTQGEIASKLNCSAANVHQIIYNAFRILRQRQNKSLSSYRDEIIGMSFSRGSFSRFANTLESSVEWAVIKLNDNFSN